jgi:hypothetical protein
MRDDLRRWFDIVKEVVVRSSQEGRLRVDLALLQHEKRALLAELGAEAVRLLDAGEIAPAGDLDWLRDRLRDIEARIGAERLPAHDNAYGAPRGYEPEAGNYEDTDDDLDEPEAVPGQ